MTTTHDPVPVEAVSEYDGLPLDAMPRPQDWRYLSLAAKCCDLLHLLSFADIKTPSEGDATEAGKVMASIRQFINTEPSPVEAVSEDTRLLDWLESNECTNVFKIGNRWYTRDGYNEPHRRANGLRAAIRAAIAASPSSSKEQP